MRIVSQKTFLLSSHTYIVIASEAWQSYTGIVFTNNYFVYILTNPHHTVLYIGVTNNIVKRVFEHKNKLVAGFTKKYNVHKLLYYEIFNDIQEAINREKQLKAGSRKKKIDLIQTVNPLLEDLYENLL
jgi:putative endonuclease